MRAHCCSCRAPASHTGGCPALAMSSGSSVRVPSVPHSSAGLALDGTRIRPSLRRSRVPSLQCRAGRERGGQHLPCARPPTPGLTQGTAQPRAAHPTRRPKGLCSGQPGLRPVERDCCRDLSRGCAASSLPLLSRLGAGGKTQDRGRTPAPLRTGGLDDVPVSEISPQSSIVVEDGEVLHFLSVPNLSGKKCLITVNSC